MITLNKLSELDLVLNKEDKEQIYIKENNQVYQYNKGEDTWEKAEIVKEIPTGITLYDINKAIYSKSPKLSNTELSKKLSIVKTFVESTANKYYMLLNNRDDFHYYTLFHIKNPKDVNALLREFKSIITDLGEIKDIALTKGSDAVEIWISQKEESELAANVGMYLLFGYDKGVIECK